MEAYVKKKKNKALPLFLSFVGEEESFLCPSRFFQLARRQINKTKV